MKTTNTNAQRFEDILFNNQEEIVQKEIATDLRHETQLFSGNRLVATRVITDKGVEYFFAETSVPVSVFYKSERLLPLMQKHFSSHSQFPVFFEVQEHHEAWALNVMPEESVFAINDTRFGIPVVVQVLFNENLESFRALPLRVNVAIGNVEANALSVPGFTVYLSEVIWPEYNNHEIVYTLPEGNGNPVLINHNTGERWVLSDEFQKECLI